MYKLKLCNMRRSYYDPTGAISVEQHKYASLLFLNAICTLLRFHFVDV
jgi:hypothetical protein